MKLLARGGFPCTFAAKLAGRTVSLIAGREGGHHELFANVCTQLVRVRGGLIKLLLQTAVEPHQTEWLQSLLQVTAERGSCVINI